MSDSASRVLLPWRQESFPIDWSAEFAREAALHLEIGFGDGRFTLRRALEHPKDAFVGLEISSASLQRGWKKLKRNGLSNVRLIKLGAQFAVQHLFAPDSLSSIVVNFPDPWPKEKHEKNRLLQDSFFKLAASRLKAGGSINLATDHPDYLAFAREQSQLSGLYDLLEPPPPQAVFETKYALKWKGQGKPLYYQLFRYNGAPTPEYPILERPATMPHALIQGQLPETIEFSKQVLAYANGHVILHEVLKSIGSDDEAPSQDKWLFRATIDEEDLKQQILVVVKRRSADELIVRLEPFGDPVITKTTRGAVHAVTEWLLSLPAGIRVLERNY
ncbi:MAG: tRNA (guanosine(46)-N7)-methyltransferase TrmB [Trueperaceae bacterium]|nr:tRNA (guanosine(46)-N7)-methyltransferase TrmB [Trueperaceae bacterium]